LKVARTGVQARRPEVVLGDAVRKLVHPSGEDTRRWVAHLAGVFVERRRPCFVSSDSSARRVGLGKPSAAICRSGIALRLARQDIRARSGRHAESHYAGPRCRMFPRYHLVSTARHAEHARHDKAESHAQSHSTTTRSIGRKGRMERLDSSCAAIRPGPWINGPGTLQVTRAAENQDHPDRSKLAGYGPNTADVNAVAQWALGGNATAQVCEREKISGVAVRGLEPDVVDAPNPEH
jgi:hypothetical protein